MKFKGFDVMTLEQAENFIIEKRMGHFFNDF